MKYKISSFCFICCFFLSCKKTVSTNDDLYSSIFIEEKEHNFSKKNANDTISFTFKIKNISNVPYEIIAVSQSCGCTTTNFTDGPILIDEYADVTVEYIPESEDFGEVMKSIVVSDNSNEGFQVFYLKGIIENN